VTIGTEGFGLIGYEPVITVQLEESADFVAVFEEESDR
jgi:hypothetical protein